MGFSSNGMTSLKNNASLRNGNSFLGTKGLDSRDNPEKLAGKSDLAHNVKREIIYRKNIRLAAEIIFYLTGVGLTGYYFLFIF